MLCGLFSTHTVINYSTFSHLEFCHTCPAVHAEHNAAAKLADNHQHKAKHVPVHSSRAKKHEPQAAKQHTPEVPPVQDAPAAAAAEEFDPSRATIPALKVDPERVEVHLAAAQAGPRASNPRASAPRVSVPAVLASAGGKCPKGLYLVDDGCVACEDYRQPSDCRSCKPPEQCSKYGVLHRAAQTEVVGGIRQRRCSSMFWQGQRTVLLHALPSQADGPAGGPQQQQQRRL